MISVLACGVALVTVAGCHGKNRGAVQLEMARMDEMRETPRAYLDNMADNAILHDMSLADFHFIPHSTELSGAGVAHLDRMALLLDTYGGVVRYETFSSDEDLIKKRLEHVKEYLTLVGCSMEKVALTTAVSGGRGMGVHDLIKPDGVEDKAFEMQMKRMENTTQRQGTSFTSLTGQ